MSFEAALPLTLAQLCWACEGKGWGLIATPKSGKISLLTDNLCVCPECGGKGWVVVLGEPLKADGGGDYG